MKIRYFPPQSQEPVVINVSTDFDEEIPQWDVALEALMREEFQHLGRPLRLADFEHLARQYAIRFDDIMATAFELVIHGKWRYRDEQGGTQAVTRAAVDRLNVSGRLERRDIAGYTGSWSPAERD